MNLIADYRIIDKIYQGSHSLVYKGYRDSDKLPVVLKVLNKDYPTPEEMARFKREFEITQNLVLKGVIKAYTIEKYQNSLAIVLEDFGGKSLNNIEINKLNLIQLLSLSIQITQTLGEIHQQNIMHKNINPSNIVWNSKTNEVKIIDFGISTTLSRENPSVSNPSMLEGTLSYISPEQTGRMNRSVDYRTDLYSLGVTLYEFLTGKLPFDTKDPIELVHCHIAINAKSPYQINSNLPKSLSKIIMKCLAKNPEDRYQSAFGIKADLERSLNQLNKANYVEDFEIGQNDISDKFHISQKLYGRENEIDILLTAFDRVSQGLNEMMLVAGYSGVGKSALVHEIHKPIVEKRGYFISGKFDQFKRNIPYASLIQAFQELVRQILTESEQDISNWKKKLLKAFGPNGQIVIEVIPEVELIIGEQPTLPELPPTQAQNRFNLVFQDFVKTFATKDHPLVIFLDDLQWTDLPSLKLIELFITDLNTKYMFTIGAYRDNEVDSGHPLMLTLDGTKKAGATINTITLQPLDLSHVNELIADSLYCDTNRSKPLAELCFDKTQGNPFFLNQLLHSFYEDKLINFDLDKALWHWKVEEIKKADMTDNVLELMSAKIKKLSDSTQQVLKLAACIGNKFELKILSIVHEKSLSETANDLWESLSEGLILPLNDSYKFVQDWDDVGDRTSSSSEGQDVREQGGDRTSSSSEGQDVREQGKVSYQFLHDRVQQAAYSLIQKEKKKEVHLSIGRLMLQTASTEEREENIIEIVRHLNEGIGMINDISEREELARLNLAAGKKAKMSAAYRPALEYFNVGKELVSDWEKSYELIFDLLKANSECAYICGEFEQAEDCAKTLIDKAKTNLEKADIYHMQATQYTTIGKLDNAIDTSLTGIKLLGMEISKYPDDSKITEILTQINQNLGQQNIADLVNSTVNEDLTQKMIMKLIPPTILATYVTGNEKLLVLSILVGVDISLRYGNTPESAFVYNLYGFLLGSVFDDYKTGYQFGKLAIEVIDRFDEMSWKAAILFTYTAFIQTWNDHPRTFTDWYKRVIDVGLETGDLIYVGYAGINISPWNPDYDLNTLIKEGKKYLNIVQSTKYQNAIDMAFIFHHLWLNFRSETNDRFSLSSPLFDEIEGLQRLKQVGYITGVAIYYIYKIQPFYYYEDYQSALMQVEEADKVIMALNGQPHTIDFCIYAFLTYAALVPKMNTKDKKQAWKRLEKEYNQMKIWSDHNPIGFIHFKLLMEAEMAKLSEKRLEAHDLYDQAIETAEKNGFLRYEALANELAGKFWLTLDKHKLAGFYLSQAIYLYKLWGAIAKVKHLEEKYPHLLTQTTRTNKSFDYSDTTTDSFAGTTISKLLDLSTVMKASQTISGEIILAELLKKMMKIVIENAGAQKGFLILNKKNQWFIEGYIQNTDIKVLQSIPVDDSQNLSAGIIHYVIRTHENVVLNDASKKDNFFRDSYIVKNQPKSILCTPLINQGKLNGILYLENNLITGAFTSDRLEVLSVLSSQMAISIENAYLYENLENLVTERTQALRDSEERYRLLVELSPEGIAVHSEGKFIFINNAWVKLFGANDPKQLIGQPIMDRIHPDFQEIVKERLEQLKETAKIVPPIDEKFIRLDGTVIDVEAVSISFIYKEKPAILTIARDITERKRVERLRADTERIVRHDLKNPINGIEGYSQLILSDRSATEKQREWAFSIYNIANQMLHMINHSLDLFKMEEGTYLLKSKEFNLIQMMNELKKEFTHLLEMKSIELVHNVNGEIVIWNGFYPIFGEINHIKSLFANLIKNAIEASPINRKVTISIKDLNGDHQIMIHNHGVIPESIRDRFFERYSTSGKFSGTGLGTYSAKLIAKTHGGDISFITSEEDGTHIIVTLS